MRILIASGGSGGHIFPAVALAKEFEEDKDSVIFVASRRRLDRQLLLNTPYKKVFLSANPMPYGASWRFVIFLWKLALDSLQSIYLIMRYRPDVIMGFGGYTAGAILVMGKLAGIKTIIHEQNLVPGRTNKFLDKIADIVAVSFPESRKYFKNKNVEFTGNPLRKDSLEVCRGKALSDLNLDGNKFTIIVMGGSQGARSLNNLVSKSITMLPDNKKSGIQVIHIAGLKNTEPIRQRYAKGGIDSKIFEFVRNINEVYSVCDLAISRSGAAAIFELAAFKKPMILIPYPSQLNNQRFNAKFFAFKKAAVYKNEKFLNEYQLRDIIMEFIDNPAKRKEFSENAGRLSITDGARRLKEVIKGAR